MLDTHYNCMFNSSSIHKKFNFSNSHLSSLHALELYLYNFKKEINKNNHFIEQKCSPSHVVRKDVKNREKLTFQQVYIQETIF